MSYHCGDSGSRQGFTSNSFASTRRAAGLWALAALMGCGSSPTNMVLVELSNVPSRTTVLSVQATLGSKTALSAMDITQPLDRFGVALPPDASGLLTLNVQALDSDRCTQGTAAPSIMLPGQGLDPPLTAAVVAQTPRKCGAQMGCADGTLCSYNPALNNPVTIKGMWAVTPNNIWAAGWNGTLLHYDGATWSSVVSGVSGQGNDLNAIWGSSANDIWAVGVPGTIHYDGNSWSPVFISITYSLNAVFGISANDAWAVGDSGLTTQPGEFWHWDGKSWKSVPNFVNGQLLGVWASATTDVFASGAAGLMLHYNGTNVVPMSTPTPYDLTALWGSANNQVFSVGANGTIIKYDGATWKSISSGVVNKLNAIFGTVSTLYAAGNGGTVVKSSAALDSFAPYITKGPATTLTAGQLTTNGLAWLGGPSEFVGFFDTRP